ncbi:uncharacterized protein LY79DRAFT_198774 [Colletotrichum navitas]|uniref:Uncharacterized protein n=1 Tax=Colletotrichum navitas TaxID=681940 RepID=A0AAD8PZC5_9PEZI|nr:uncharacterized protein LY79DRAFT_198774 [Colletotrichum navitas]KAK1590736.1 hypothetical protein LY79DRAFT_198774 [Colletotrichum navitas]
MLLRRSAALFLFPWEGTVWDGGGLRRRRLGAASPSLTRGDEVEGQGEVTRLSPVAGEELSLGLIAELPRNSSAGDAAETRTVSVVYRGKRIAKGGFCSSGSRGAQCRFIQEECISDVNDGVGRRGGWLAHCCDLASGLRVGLGFYFNSNMR